MKLIVCRSKSTKMINGRTFELPNRDCLGSILWQTLQRSISELTYYVLTGKKIAVQIAVRRSLAKLKNDNLR